MLLETVSKLLYYFHIHGRMDALAFGCVWKGRFSVCETQVLPADS